MRDPRGGLKGGVDGRSNDKVFGVQAKVDAAGQGILNRATKGVDGVMDRAEGAKKKKKKKKPRMSWWPFGGGDEEESIPACPQCNREVDESWQACPYCGYGVAAAGAAAPLPNQGAPAAAPGPNLPQINGNRTQAIDIAQLKRPTRRLVGWIVVMNGAQQYTDHKVFEGVNSIGAAADNDIVVTDDYLSSKHASIRFEDNEYYFFDHDSTNGSYVNEKKVNNKEELIDNDTIRLGRTEFRFKALY